MNRRFLLSMMLNVLGMSTIGAGPAHDATRVVAGNTAFACDLYGKLRAQPGNVFCSPFSISAALAMTAAGAKGATYDEMAKALHLPPGERVHADYAALLAQLQASPKAGYELNIANALWGKKGFPFQPAFVNGIAKNYGGGLQQVDFGKPAEAATIINAWVEEQTKQRIKDLIKPAMLGADTRLILTNAIYFKGLWQHQFRKDATRNEPFFTAEGKSSPVPMMHQHGRFNYVDGDGIQLVELPYKGERLSMVIALPKSRFALTEAIEAKLTPERIGRMLAAAKEMKGDVALPRFEFKTDYNLNEPLLELGMARAFSNGADFSGMTSAEPLKIGLVVHKAFVRVDEEGSEAAAATGVLMIKAPAPIEESFTFRADQPFVFAIRDTQTGSLLFLGRMSDAAASKAN